MLLLFFWIQRIHSRWWRSRRFGTFWAPSGSRTRAVVRSAESVFVRTTMLWFVIGWSLSSFWTMIRLVQSLTIGLRQPRASVRALAPRTDGPWACGSSVAGLFFRTSLWTPASYVSIHGSSQLSLFVLFRCFLDTPEIALQH